MPTCKILRCVMDLRKRAIWHMDCSPLPLKYILKGWEKDHATHR